MDKSDFGIVGLGVMAGAYARNLYFRGFKIAVWTRSEGEVKVFKEKLEADFGQKSGAKKGEVECYLNLQEFVDALEKPRKIMILITAGKAVDMVLDRLIPALDKDDLVIDGGNEWYKNTNSRIERCKAEGIKFAGMGISGGERGARLHPCFMFGGDLEHYRLIRPILSQENEDFYVGLGASGHYVKMVHNGIEYGILQLIAEVYSVLRGLNGMNNGEISDLMSEWDREDGSYLLQITKMILKEKEGNDYLVDKITPCISSNGTGKWTVQDSFDLSVPVPSIGMSVDMRSVSNMSVDGGVDVLKLDNRKAVNKEDLRAVYVCSLLVLFSQGMHLLTEASKEHKWELKMDVVADIWSRNSIISCNILTEISESFKTSDKLLLLHDGFKDMVLKSLSSWKGLVKHCLDANLPVPVVNSTLQYVQVLYTKRSGHNLIQAQRDCFGSHTFKRVDAEGNFHHDWWKDNR